MNRIIQRKLSVLLIGILSLGLLWSEDAFARGGFGGGGFGRGMGRSSRSFARSTPRRATPNRTTGRGIKSSRTNAKSSGFTRSKASSAALSRGASPTRIGKNAPSRAGSVGQFKTAQRQATAKQTYQARTIKGSTVQTATPSGSINRSNKQYGQNGMYRGTTRDTYRGTTVIHNYGYGGMGMGGGFGGFWTGYMMANITNMMYFNMFYHNWNRMDRQSLRDQIPKEEYEKLEQRVAELEAQGVPRDPENNQIEVPDRDVQAYLDKHPEQQEEYYAATYELDRAQSIEEPLETDSGKSSSEDSGGGGTLYFLLGMGAIWLVLRKW
ncbi:MAG: hypothetical protein V1800_04125 [Candidatus Latescibacterota bacterium]